MTAYELAKALQETEPYYLEDDKLFDNTANMLRQQADRIAELEKQLEEKNKPPTKFDTLMESQTRKFWGSLDNQCHGYTTPQTKPLSDEEIWEWFEKNTALAKESALMIGRAIEAKVRGQ